MSCTLTSSLNYVSDILDEVALEGLDGITLEALWMRLSVRPKFMFSIDVESKRFLWKIIYQLKDLKFYEIPVSRPSLKYYDYSVTDENICNEIRIELDEVYSYHSVKNVSGIFGSCQYFSSRVDITETVIEMNVEEVENKWGNKLVIVASQCCRNAALFGNCCTPNIDFSSSPLNYEILERIGRCRQLGSVTCGKGSLQSLVVDVKSIFHYLKCLINHNLVKKQSLLGSLSSNSHASLVYLSRFFEETANENISILRMAIEELKARPPHFMMPCDELYSLFDGPKKKRIKKYKASVVFRRYITVTPSLPYRTVYPNAPQVEWEKKSKSGEKSVRCFKLINPNVEVTDIVEKECDSDEEEGNTEFLPRGIYYKNTPIVFQAYHHIKNAGAKGLSHSELGQIMGLNKYFIRGLIKRLFGDKLCKFYFETDGKRRSKRYIVGENTQTKEAACEIAQILLEPANKFDSKEQEIPETTETPSKVEKIEQVEKINLPKLQEENMSYRSLKRIGLIIKTIKAHRFRVFHQIKKYVHEEEKKEGLTITVDRLTIQKLLKKLESDGLIKKVVLTGNLSTDHSIKIYTDPAFDPDEKLKESIYAVHSTCTFVSDRKEDGLTFLETEFSTALIENLGEMQKMLSGIVRTAEKPVARESELTFLHSPKFIRLNLLHEFMFYLVYDYTGLKDRSQEELLKELCRTTNVEEDLKTEMPKLYNTEPSTYMFVPPLNNSGSIPGWFLISDLLTRMPLSMMVKMVKVTESCSELWHYLHHPIRKHFLVKDLPLPVRRLFFCRRNQITNFYFDMRRLCFIGLVQFGPKFGKEHYQTILYLNRKASLLDTSSSPPSYIKLPANVEFSLKMYDFRTQNDVKKYWVDMFDICMGTKLGEKESTKGNEMLTERELSKESLKKYYEPKSVEQALEHDNGSIPGDHLGAGGLDSAMFSFSRNNWTGPVTKNLTKNFDRGKTKYIKMPVQKLRKEQRKFDKERKKFGSIKTRRKLIAVNVDKVLSIPKLKARKKLKKLRERETEVKRSRKPSYDEVDLEALKLMNTLRVTWSTPEDNILLLCRVAMTFLCPNPKTFAKIPRVEVRKALQHFLPESRNKTQRATARRIVYMMKNPTTVRGVNLCLEKLKEMPESKAFDCSDLIEKIKPTAPNLVENQQELYKKFHELLSFLKDRFIDNPTTNPGKDNNDLIPNSLEEFLEKFQLETPIEEALDVKTIRENVIRGILMSSFCCRSDKTSSAVQLFDIYRQYNEDELKNAIKNLHQDKVITIAKRSGSSMFKTGNILPLAFSPFKLSFAFQHLLNMKYAHSVYSESYFQISKFMVAKDEEEFPVDLNECNLAIFLLASKEILIFRPVLPDQIIAFEKGDLSDSTYSKMVEKYCRMLEYSESDSKVLCTFGNVISKSEDVNNLRESDAKKRKMCEPDGFQSKRARGEESVSEETEKRTSSDSDESLKPSDQGNEKKTRSSRVILYMMREEAKKDAKQELSGRLVQEFCVVNSSQVFAKCRKETLEMFTKEMDTKGASMVVKNIVSRSLFPTNLVDEESTIENRWKEENQRQAVKKILEFICSKKELGATAEDLKQNCSHDMLSKFVQNLTESKIILKSGINETRYVSQKYSSPWLLSSFKMKRIEREKLKPTEATAVALTSSDLNDEKPKKRLKGVVELKNEDFSPPTCSSNVNNKVKVVIRPWVRIDGSLNRKVLDRFLGTILGFVMSHPGCTLRDIIEKFLPSITPVWTKDLVEILNEIGCVTLKTLVIREKCTLFTRCFIEICDEYSGLESDDCTIVEAKIDAMIILGLFIGKRTYSKDFLFE